MCDKLWSLKTCGHCDHRMSTNRSACAFLAQRSLSSGCWWFIGTCAKNTFMSVFLLCDFRRIVLMEGSTSSHRLPGSGFPWQDQLQGYVTCHEPLRWCENSRACYPLRSSDVAVALKIRQQISRKHCRYFDEAFGSHTCWNNVCLWYVLCRTVFDTYDKDHDSHDKSTMAHALAITNVTGATCKVDQWAADVEFQATSKPGFHAIGFG